MNTISALIRRNMRELTSSLSALCHVRISEEDSHLQTRKWALTKHWMCQQLHLGLSSLQNKLVSVGVEKEMSIV